MCLAGSDILTCIVASKESASVRVTCATVVIVAWFGFVFVDSGVPLADALGRSCPISADSLASDESAIAWLHCEVANGLAFLPRPCRALAGLAVLARAITMCLGHKTKLCTSSVQSEHLGELHCSIG